ncbi:MAG: tetratricopeptide repeat protein [Myxococcota bacterium]
MTPGELRVPTDAEELDGLVRFLLDSPGEIAGAVVPGAVGGDAVVSRVRLALASDLEVVDAGQPILPDALGDLAAELAASETMLVVRLDRHLHAAQSDRLAFWQRLNYQRERLAQRRLRVLMVLGPQDERYLAAAADDLRDWVFLFRFPEAMPAAEGRTETVERTRTRARDKRPSALRVQLERAREQLPPERLIPERVLPLLRSAIARDDWDEARRLWNDDLDDGVAWRRYRASQPATDDLAPGDAKRLVDDLLAIQAVALAAGHEEQSLDAALEAIKVQQRRVDPTPQYRANLAESRIAASRSLMASGKINQSVSMLEQAVASLRTLGEDERGSLANALIEQASVLHTAGRHEQALESAEEAVELRRALVEDESARSQALLAAALMVLRRPLRELGRTDQSRFTTQEAVEIYRRLADDDPNFYRPNLVDALQDLVFVLTDQGRHEEALAAAEEVVGLYRTLPTAPPNSELALVLRALAHRLAALGRDEQALAVWRETVELHRAFTTPLDLGLAEALQQLGLRLGALDRHDEAIAATEEAASIYREIVAQQPRDPVMIWSLAVTLRHLGDQQAALGQHDTALASTQQALEVLQSNPVPRAELAKIFDHLGDRYTEQERVDEAIAAKEDAAKHYRYLQQQGPPSVLADLTRVLEELAALRNRAGDMEGTQSLTKEALQLRMMLPDQERLAASTSSSLSALSREELLQLIRPYTRARAVYWSLLVVGAALAIMSFFLPSSELSVAILLLSTVMILLSLRKLQQIPIEEIQRAIELYEIRSSALEQRKQQMQAHGLPAERIKEKIAPEQGHSTLLLIQDLFGPDEDVVRMAHGRALDAARPPATRAEPGTPEHSPPNELGDS